MPADLLSIPSRDLNSLWPKFAELVQECLDECNKLGYDIAVFESTRTAARQDWLYAAGRTRPGPRVTNAKGWESAHQGNVAVDIARRRDSKWSWDFPADKVAKLFTDRGLEWLNPYEQCHFQMCGGLGGKVVGAMARDLGLQRTWAEIQHAIDMKHK